MIIVPMGLGLLASSVFIINHFYKQKAQLEGLVVVSDSFDDFGKMITYLQMERGKSGLYLSKKISLDELTTHQREKTDPQVTESRSMIEQMPLNADDKKIFSSTLDELTVLRKKVADHAVKVSEAIGGYSKIIQSTLVLEGQAATLYSGKGIDIRLIHMSVVESLKEAIGVVRGLYTGIFAADLPLSQEELSKAHTAEATTHVIASSSAMELKHGMHAKIKELLSSPSCGELENDLLKVVKNADKGHYGVDPVDFFARMSKVVGKIEAVIEAERVDIYNEAKSEAAHSAKIFYLVTFFVLLALAAMIIFSWIIMRDLVLKEAEVEIANTASIRSSSMVENSPISTMMCDPSGTLIYMNGSTIENLRKLQTYLPEKVDNLIGKSIDIFHKNPATQRKIISDPRNLPHRAVIALGPEKLDLLVTASIDPAGKYLGAALTWSIVTARVELIKDLTKSSEDLASASSNVLAISSNLSAAAEETSAQANTASVASEEVNAGVQTVASNMEEMVQAIKEITKTTNEASSMTNNAMTMAIKTNKIINQLGESSLDIGNVIKVISSIAQQTNLLALNATIEAARAGEAGKGFAVVANEVKELANQTAKATSEITKKIETIQADSKNAVEAIAEISGAIDKVNGYTGNIAASIEEQAATTNEVTRIVTESAEGVKQISENISQVSQAAANTGKDAGSAQAAAKEVGTIAELLKKYVARLKIES